VVTKALLITGGSRGIGRATAIMAGEQGWAVGVNYVGDAVSAEATVETIRTAGGQAMAIRGDVSVEADVIAMFEAVQSAFGPLQGLVANAGVVAPLSKLADMDLARLKRMFDINVLGAYLCAREGARAMSRGRGGLGGSIVLVSSGAARLGSPFEFIDYAGSKGAVDTLTLGLAKELAGEGVRVNAVRPGPIRTDIHASGGQPDRAERVGATTPMGRAGEAEEVAEAIAWLLSDAASYVTGALLDVTGGR